MGVLKMTEKELILQLSVIIERLKQLGWQQDHPSVGVTAAKCIEIDGVIKESLCGAGVTHRGIEYIESLSKVSKTVPGTFAGPFTIGANFEIFDGNGVAIPMESSPPPRTIQRPILFKIA